MILLLQLRISREMKDFFNDCNVQGRIDPRDAYFGGRTMAFKMLEESDDKYDISMFDIVC